jgi:hypothetical protein
MSQQLDQLARRIWLQDDGAVRLLSTLSDRSRRGVEKALRAMYGVRISLFGSETEIRARLLAVHRLVAAL